MAELMTPIPKLRSVLRWKGVILVTVAILLAWIYFLLFFDFHLKHFLERAMSRLNGAQVNITSLKTKFLKSEIDIRGIEVTNHVQPAKNLLEVNGIKLTYLFAPLFRKKLLIEGMVVEGIQFRTDREHSGELAREVAQILAVPSLVDRVASGFYGSLTRELGVNPLRHLGQLLTGLDLAPQVAANLSHLESLSHAAKLKGQIQHLSAAWSDTSTKIFPTLIATEVRNRLDEIEKESGNQGNHPQRLEAMYKIREQLFSAKSKVTQFEREVTSTLSSLESDIVQLNALVDKDVRTLMTTLRLPRFDSDDLTNTILGPRLVGYLERLTYWIDLTRRKMPKITKEGPLAEVRQERDRSTSIHYGKVPSFPALLLMHAVFSSQLSEKKSQGTVKGELSALTSDPPIYGAPARFSLEASFPAAEIEGVKLNAVIDHTGVINSEKFELRANSFPISQWSISDGGDVRLGIARGRGTLDLQATFLENELKADAVVGFTTTEFYATSRFKRLEEVIAKILEPLKSFELRLHIDGTYDKFQFASSSELGQALAVGFQSEFKHHIGAIEDTLRNNILDNVHPEVEAILHKIRILKEKTLQPIQTTLKRLQELGKDTEQTVARLVASSRKKK